MASTRQLLYDEACDFLKESHVVVGSTSPNAKRIAAIEESAAMWLLGQHPWNFATTVVRLQVVATADPDADEPDASLAGFQYAYQKPPTARINWILRSPAERDRVTSGWADKGGRILSSYSPLYMDHVQPEFALPAKIGYWPAAALTAWASLIGDRLTGPVSNSRGWESDMSVRSQALIEAAYSFDASQSPAPRRRTGRWNQARRGGFRTDDRP